MAFIYDLADTWNNVGTSFNGIKLNVTDTASAVTSKLVDLQIGSVSKFSVSKTGAVTAAGNIHSTSGGFTFPDGTTQTTKATVNSVSGTGTVSGLTLTGTVTDSGFLTLGGTLVLTSGQVTTALGYTPYNATNPAGYTTNVGTVTSVAGTGTVSGLSLTGSVTTSGSLTLGGTLVLTSSQVTDALGYTPYDATNPTGYITASALTPYLTSATAATTYQPLDGDLTAIAALAGTAGLVRKTAANTYTLDTASYLTGITSSDVTTALGYTPYNATNPAGYTTNVGTVTSVGITAGTGVSVSGGPITSSGAITVTNTAPDQVVSITGAGTATVTGTYPNFTITSTGGSGTVSSVAASGGTTGLTFTGSPITTSGTLTLGGTLATASGGTNLTSYTTGDLVYASATNTLSKLGIGTSGYVLTTNGTIPSWGLVSLTSGVTGTLPVSKGGLGNSSYTVGSLITFSSPTNSTEVAPGTSGYPLISNGTGTLPTYSQINITNATTGTLSATRGGTGQTTYATGDLLYASAPNTLSRLPIGSNNHVLTSNGTTLSWQAGGGGPGGSGVSSFRTSMSGLTPSTATTGDVVLAGTLGIANGGTGQTTKAAAFNALSPITTTGDLIIGNGSNSNTRLPIGAFGRYLYSNGSTASWQPISVDASNISGMLQTYQGGTGTTTSPSNGQLLIGNGGGYSVANLTAGANITITNSFGGITIAASGGGGGGPTISLLNVSVSGYSSFQGNAPSSNNSKPLVGTGGMAPSNYGAFVFRNMSGGYNINGASLDSIGILNSTATYVNYMSGSDFSSYPSNFRVDDSIVSCYGLQIYNAAMFTLFTDTKNAMTSPNLAPFDAMNAYSSSNPEIQVSTDMGTFFKTGGGGIVVDKNMTNYVMYFGTGNPSYTSGMTVNSIQIKPGGSGAMYTTYYSGSDFYVSYSENTSMGMFQMMMTVYNPTLQTLLDNSFRA